MHAFAYAFTERHIGEDYPYGGILAMICVLFSRRIIDEFSLLDENYGIGVFEDDEFSVGARRAPYTQQQIERVDT